MFWFYFGIYTLAIIVIWGFFTVAKIHSLKFKNYQPKIVDITRLANIILFAFTILGYLIIFFQTYSADTYSVKEKVIKKEENNLENSIGDFSKLEEDSVSEDYY